MSWQRAVVKEMGRSGWNPETSRKESGDGDLAVDGMYRGQGNCSTPWVLNAMGRWI